MKQYRCFLTIFLTLILLFSFCPVPEVWAEEDDIYYFHEQVLEDQPKDSELYMNLFSYKDQVSRLSSDGDHLVIESLANGEVLDDLAFNYKSLFQENGSRCSGLFTFDQKLFFVFADTKKKEVSVRGVNGERKLDKSLVLKDFPGLFDEYGISLRRAAADADAIFLFVAQRGQKALFVYDWSGQLRDSYYAIESFDIDGQGHFIYLQSPSEAKHYGLFCVSSDNLKELFQNQKITSGIARYNFDREKLLVLDTNRKLHSLSVKTGQELGEPYALLQDSNYLEEPYSTVDMLPGKDDSLYFCYFYTNDEQAKENPGLFMNAFVCYEKSKGTRESRDVTLTITTPYRTDFMMEAILRYEKAHPEEHVILDTAYNSQEQYLNHVDEYGEKLALRVIAGDIGDIVKTGGSHLAYRNFAQTDVFLPLNDWLGNNSHLNQLNPSILEGLKIRGDIWGLPVFYMFTQYEWNEELADQLGLHVQADELTWSGLLKFLPALEEKAPGHHLLAVEIGDESPWMGLGVDLLIVNMPDLIDFEKQTFDLHQDWFISLLKQFKKASDSAQFVNRDIPFDLQDRLQGALLRPWSSYDRDLRDGQADFVQHNRKQASTMIPMIRGEKHPNRIAYSNYMYSINARSERTESALKFLDFLLSPSIESLNVTSRMVPLNQEALKIKLDRADKENTPGDSFTGEDKDLIVRKIHEYRDAFEKHSSMVDYLYDMDYLKQDIMLPIERYMKDEIDLEEALQLAEENVTIRLFE